MANKHLIGKQCIELILPSAKNVHVTQQTVSDLVWRDLVPQLNSLFDDLVGDNEVLFFDKITIDLGEIRLHEGAYDVIVARIIELLEEECKNRLDILSHGDAIGAEPTSKGSHEPLRSYCFRIWIYWLVHGTLPPYSSKPEKNWLSQVFETLALETKAIQKLQTIVTKYPLALERLVLQHEVSDLKSIVELYTGHSQANLPIFFEELKRVFSKQVFATEQLAYRKVALDLWRTIFQKVIQDREKLSFKMLMANVLQNFKGIILKPYVEEGLVLNHKKTPILLAVIEKAIEGLPNKDKNAIRRKEKGRERPPQNNAKTIVANEDALESKQRLSEIEQVGTAKVPEVKELPENTSVEVDQEELEPVGPQFFKNAGVVLVHPFLSSFFDKLGLLKAGTFMNFECQSRAVLLLHFLCGKEETVGDFEMVLPKMLCGMPVNLPVDHTLQLSKKEKKEANRLLQAVIDHWDVLGSTTPDGLREGFLTREGKLEKEQGGWKLCVAHATLDVLLDRLPWNLSMIKLPWMKELLYVEWR